MNKPCCSDCIFAEDIGSNDVVKCTKKEEIRKVNDYPCSQYRNIKREVHTYE